MVEVFAPDHDTNRFGRAAYVSKSDSTAPGFAGKPSKPYPNFPLYAHSTKRWAKKIHGKLHFVWASAFGATNNPAARPCTVCLRWPAQFALKRVAQLAVEADQTAARVEDRSGSVTPFATVSRILSKGIVGCRSSSFDSLLSCSHAPTASTMTKCVLVLAPGVTLWSSSG